jgi:cytidylate kinase
MIGEMLGLNPNRRKLVQKTDPILRELAKRVNVIPFGRGTSFATARLAHSLHVPLVALASHRAQYLAQHFGITERAALSGYARCACARRGYVKFYFNPAGRETPGYDLMINTSRVSLKDVPKSWPPDPHRQLTQRLSALVRDHTGAGNLGSAPRSIGG